MKITYAFDTDSEDFNYQELNRIQSADRLTSCIWDIEQQLRQWYKYDNRESIPVNEICDTIYDIIKDNEINTDRLWA